MTDRDAVRRVRLAAAIDKLAHALANGDAPFDPIELNVIADLCELYELPAEAARVRFWMAGGRAA